VSQVGLNLKYYLRPATTQSPALAAQVRRLFGKEILLLALYVSSKRSASALGAGDVTVTRQIVLRFLTASSQCLSVCCCIGQVVQGAFAAV